MGDAKRRREKAARDKGYFTTKTALKEHKERVVEIKETGHRFLVRRLNLDIIGAMFDNVPELISDAGELKAHSDQSFFKAMMRPATPERQLLEAVITQGLVKPSVGKGKDQIAFLDLDFMDAVILFKEILGLSGYGAAAKKRLRPT